MALKKLCVITLCTLLCSLTFFSICQSTPEEIPSVYHADYGVLKIDIMSPVQSSPGETITVIIKVEGVSGIHMDYLNVSVYGAFNATNKVTLREVSPLKNYSFNSSSEIQEIQYEISLPNNLSSGLTYGTLSCGWEYASLQETIPVTGFPMTYIENTDLEQLQTRYEELNATYQTLLKDYKELESGFNEEVDSTRNLLYIFVITTIVASITVIILLMRKPKKIWI